jgi:hypothetical protein
MGGSRKKTIVRCQHPCDAPQYRGFFMQTLRALTLTSLALAACKDDSLSKQVALIDIVPQPTSAQAVITDPVGIDLGDVPLFGYGTARFRVENPSVGILQITAASLEGAGNGSFEYSFWNGDEALSLPVVLRSQQTAELRLQMRPAKDEVRGGATLRLATNAGTSGDQVVHVRVTGVGKFIGDPRLEIDYNGVTYALPEDCTVSEGVCTLPTCDFGNVALGAHARVFVRVRNVPLPETCQMPPLDDGTSDCTPACAVTFAAGAEARGVGIVPDDQGFRFQTSTAVPFLLSPAQPECAEEPGLIRGELALPVRFEAGDEAADNTATVLLESDYRDLPLIRIPLHAAARQAPIAVATLRACDASGGPCSVAEDLEPLGRVYLDGTGSHDPQGLDLTSYVWRVIRAPVALESPLLAPRTDPTNAAYFDMTMPQAGEYTVRLTVTNSAGVASGASETSDVTFTAVPKSRLHLQMVWDHPTNDQDLHLVNAGKGDMVYHKEYDCFWQQCDPGCTEEEGCEPVQWFDSAAAFEGPNPRLDRDDQYGLGPENLNIDRPEAGSYNVYVHYYTFTDAEMDDPTIVTVRVYIDGVLRNEFRRTLGRNDLWAVAQISWGDTPQVRAAASDGAGLVGSVVQLNHMPYPDGFRFAPSPF